jgi:hypothetical protein
MWGNVRIEYEIFGTREESLKIVEELYQKISAWDREILCGDPV